MMSRFHINSTRRRLQGFSLLEALVSLVVLSMGLLGMAGLQTRAINVSHHSAALSRATIAAHDMIERMRANPAGMKTSAYNLPAATRHSDCFTTTGCTPAEMAENDMYEWTGADTNALSSLTKILPRGSATVCIDSTPDDGIKARDEALATDGDDATSANDPASCDGAGDVYAIKVWWLGADSSARQRYVTTVAF